MNFVALVFVALAIFHTQQIGLVSGQVPQLKRPVYDEDGKIKYFPRIVGGRRAHENEFNGLVSIQTWKGEHICGGTWVQVGNQSQILTAAHCVMDSKRHMYPRLLLQIMADDLSISKSSPGPRRQIRKVRKVTPHPQYHPVTLVHDIAMIFLTSPFKETSTFSPIHIANKSIFDYQPCSVAGWGNLRENGPQTIELMIINVSIVPWKICNGPYSYNKSVGRHAFCAGTMEGGADSCQGDSGGGLITDKQLSGIVSFGNGCGKRNFPGVYTNVYHYSQWIRQTINASPAMIVSSILMPTAITVTILTWSMFG